MDSVQPVSADSNIVVARRYSEGESAPRTHANIIIPKELMVIYTQEYHSTTFSVGPFKTHWSKPKSEMQITWVRRAYDATGVHTADLGPRCTA